MATDEKRPTMDEANDALHQLLNPDEVVREAEPEAEVAPVQAEAVVAETTPTEVVEETPSDDVASLKKRLEEFETKANTERKLYEDRWKAFEDRRVANERILRDRLLRKSTAADRALKVLKSTRTEEGVPESEVDRVIREVEGTMNPASPSYVPPMQGPEVTEDQAITLNAFLNEKAMTNEEAAKFGQWVQTKAATVMSPMEQAVAQQSIDGFLRLAHARYQQSVSEEQNQAKRNDTIDAIRSVQKTQKETAKAASSVASAPRKQSVAPSKAESAKLTRDDISALLRQSVEDNY